MTLTSSLAALADRVAGLDVKLGERSSALEDRVARLDVKTDERFSALEDRVARLDAKTDERFKTVDGRFEEQRAQMLALHEASRADFNNLYDFVRAHAKRTDTRFDQLQADLGTRFADLHAAIATLSPRLRRARRRQ